MFLQDGGKPVIPVVLKHVDVDRHGLHGLEARKLFWLEPARGDPRSFEACRSDAERARFARELSRQIEERLQRWMAVRSDPLTHPHPPRLAHQGGPLPGMPDEASDPVTPYEDVLYAWKAEGNIPAHLIRSRARETHLRGALDEASADAAQARSVVALEVLQDWARDPHAAPYCAILGEYGIGKTTTLKQFTAALLKERRAGKPVPLPIFIDLRLYSPTIHKGEVPRLETLLQEVLDRVWESTRPPAFTAQDVLRLVREEGAILIFDGLDEKLVHLDETQGRAFLRTLWNALPPSQARADRTPTPEARRHGAMAESETGRPQGRLIFSCRSHYFKTLRDQNAMLRGEDREGIRASHYRAWVLLPFDEAQIREYLGGVLGPARVEGALALFASVHNLRELAERPYLLSLIAEHIGELEARQARGGVVRGVTLYGLLVDEWLARDGGKHHWRPEDKVTLMEDIAADMWQDAAREWPWPRVLDWLGARLARDEVLRVRYVSVGPALLEEDFRTATFVLRPDASQESFRFAHTSLQEYFLARYLLRALVEHEAGRWELPLPSPETLDFLGQLLVTAPARQRDAALHALGDLLGSYRPRASDIAFRYWLQAVRLDLPAPAPWMSAITASWRHRPAPGATWAGAISTRRPTASGSSPPSTSVRCRSGDWGSQAEPPLSPAWRLSSAATSSLPPAWRLSSTVRSSLPPGAGGKVRMGDVNAHPPA